MLPSGLGGRRPAAALFDEERRSGQRQSLIRSHLYKLYRPFYRRLPAAEKFCRETLHLPYYPALKDSEVDRVVETVRRFRR